MKPQESVVLRLLRKLKKEETFFKDLSREGSLVLNSRAYKRGGGWMPPPIKFFLNFSKTNYHL